MRLTTRTRYAVRALAYLGRHYIEGAVTLKEIAFREGVTEKYLEQIFYSLSKAGLISTKKGPGGGYTLSRDPGSIKLSEIMSAVGESFAPVFCVADNKIKNCKRSRRCAARPLWQELNKVLENFFYKHTLKDLCKNG